MPHNTVCETLTEPDNFQCPYKVVTCLKHYSWEPLCLEKILILLDTLHLWAVFIYMDVFQFVWNLLGINSVTHTIQCSQSHLGCHTLSEMSFPGWQRGHWTRCGFLLVWAGSGEWGLEPVENALSSPLLCPHPSPCSRTPMGYSPSWTPPAWVLPSGCSSSRTAPAWVPSTAHSSSGAGWFACFPLCLLTGWI